MRDVRFDDVQEGEKGGEKGERTLRRPAESVDLRTSGSVVFEGAAIFVIVVVVIVGVLGDD